MSAAEPVRPLDVLTSIKARLGALVGVSVLAAALLGTVGSATGVPTWLTLPVAVALALGVTQIFAAGMTAPLRQMTEVAQRMARGDWSGRVHTGAQDEVGRLAAAFNTMAADLESADRERRTLLASVSHELRTPLAGLTAVLENLADGVVPADERHLGEAVAQAERLGRLVGDLMELSRLEAGVTPLACEQVGLRGLVDACAADVAAAGREGPVDNAVPEDLVVPADPLRLRQLVSNVLDNALRHGSGDVPVRVTAAAADAGWWLEVADDGPGVPLPDRDRVFEWYRTGSDAGGGTGLGLAVARWVAQLHGGGLGFVDPGPDATPGTGAAVRLSVPVTPAPAPARVAGHASAAAPEPVGATALPGGEGEREADPLAPDPSSASPGGGGPTDLLDPAFGSWWPVGGRGPRALLVVASALVGLLAGALVPFHGPGLGWAVVLLAAGATAAVAARRRSEPFTVTCSVLALLLVLPLVLLDAEWIGVLGVLAAAAVFLVGVVGGRTVRGFLLAWLSWPLASLRGLPWFGRVLHLAGTGERVPAVVRTVAWSVAGVLVFGALLASADAVFASWVDAVVPSFSLGDLVPRGFVAVAVAAVTLAAAFVAAAPPRVERGEVSMSPLRNRFEWLAPVLLVDAVLLVFLLAQARVAFGGHGYVRSTTGLTYAEYVHQGFGQLTVTTLLTLLVVWAASRRAGRERGDVRALRLSLGLLCGLTLVVVASALSRMHVYQEAYGFTRLRLLADLVEAWLGVLVVGVLVAGILGHARWLPRFGLLVGAVALLGLAVVNPDHWIAEHNLERAQRTGELDVAYLQGLSDDAVPAVVDGLPAQDAVCVLEGRGGPTDGGVWSWTLGRARAERAAEDLPPAPDAASCASLLARYPAGPSAG
jgi:two-component system sensor histidine kinase BaeS